MIPLTSARWMNWQAVAHSPCDRSPRLSRFHRAGGGAVPEARSISAKVVGGRLWEHSPISV